MSRRRASVPVGTQGVITANFADFRFTPASVSLATPQRVTLDGVCQVLAEGKTRGHAAVVIQCATAGSVGEARAYFETPASDPSYEFLNKIDGAKGYKNIACVSSYALERVGDMMGSSGASKGVVLRLLSQSYYVALDSDLASTYGCGPLQVTHRGSTTPLPDDMLGCHVGMAGRVEAPTSIAEHNPTIKIMCDKELEDNDDMLSVAYCSTRESASPEALLRLSDGLQYEMKVTSRERVASRNLEGDEFVQYVDAVALEMAETAVARNVLTRG